MGGGQAELGDPRGIGSMLKTALQVAVIDNLRTVVRPSVAVVVKVSGAAIERKVSGSAATGSRVGRSAATWRRVKLTQEQMRGDERASQCWIHI